MAVVRKVLRDAWDTVIFRCMIGNCARVPLSDNFLARRIAGPGMASTYYFQIKTEQALAALETAMDLDRLQVYHVSCDFLRFFKKKRTANVLPRLIIFKSRPNKPWRP